MNKDTLNIQCRVSGKSIDLFDEVRIYWKGTFEGIGHFEWDERSRSFFIRSNPINDLPSRVESDPFRCTFELI